jgi:AraC family transcriptional regulator
MSSASTSRQGSPPAATLSVPGFDVVAGVHEASSLLGRHTHDRPTICSVQHGRFTEYYPGKAVACDERMLKVTPAGEPHWNRFDAVDTYGLRIDVDASRMAEAPELVRLLDERVFLPAGPFLGVTRRLAAELQRPDEFSPLAAEGLLLELLARMARLAEPHPAMRPRWLARANEVVHETYRSPAPVSKIAAAVGVPATTLARAFRRWYGVSIGEHVRQLRLENAAERLVRTDDALAEVALGSGFYDQSHFTNAFRRQFGTTPGRYRRLHGGRHWNATPRRPPRA